MTNDSLIIHYQTIFSTLARNYSMHCYLRSRANENNATHFCIETIDNKRPTIRKTKTKKSSNLESYETIKYGQLVAEN